MAVTVRELFARFGVEFDKKPLVDGNKAVDASQTKIKDLKKGIDALDKASPGGKAVRKLAELREQLERLEKAKDPTERTKLRIADLKKEIEELGEKTVADLKDPPKKLDELKKAAEGLGKAKGLSETAEALGTLKDALVKYAAPIAAAIGLTVAFTREMVAIGLQLGDTSREIGTTATEMRAWQMVAETNGVPIEAMDSALQTLGGHLREAATRSGDARYQFRRLHVEWSDGAGAARDTSAVMFDTGRAIASIANPVLRSRMGARMLGDSWRQLAPIFEGSGIAIEEQRQAVRDLLGGDMEELTTQARAVRGEQARLTLAWQAAAASVAKYLLPVYGALLHTAAAVIGTLKRWLDQTNLVRSVLIVLAIAGTYAFLQLAAAAWAAFAPMLLAAAPMIALFVGLVLVIDDLVALFTGGNSVIGSFLNRFFGAKAATHFVLTLRQAVRDLMDAFHGEGPIAEFWQHFSEYARGAGDAIKNFFHDLFADIMNGLFEGIPGYTRRLHHDETAPGAGEVRNADGSTTTHLSPAVRARIAAIAAAHPSHRAAVPSTHPATPPIQVHAPVGQIVVDGADNPEETAHAVHRRLTQHHEESIRAARRHLTHRVAAT